MNTQLNTPFTNSKVLIYAKDSQVPWITITFKSFATNVVDHRERHMECNFYFYAPALFRHQMTILRLTIPVSSIPSAQSFTEQFGPDQGVVLDTK